VSRHVVSVQLLTSYIRDSLEADELLADLWVEGEVAETFVARSGHVYFTLRDTDSQLKCVLFRAQAQRLRSLPRAGDQIAAHGRISVYERDGTYQHYVDFVQPAGLGILALQRELLRKQLAAEGLFDPSRKRPIPALPSCIGVVTSAEGAVWQDIQHVLRRRFPLVHLLLAPAPVQGDSAPAGIVAALQALQDDGRPDVIILARGGGSADDLSCFNDERVVRAVFACRIPVVSGVGHETDWTLVDDVADLRAPTPSVAAELCSPSIVDLAERLVNARQKAERLIHERIFAARDSRDALDGRLWRTSPARTIGRHRERIDELKVNLQLRGAAITRGARSRLIDLRRSMRSSLQDGLNDRTRDLELASTRLGALDPSAVLRRGYAHLTVGDDGRVVRGVADVLPGDRFAARVADGVIVGSVIGIKRRYSATAEDTYDSL
jgi:exodeoxyribonuclease VII large subunit